MKPADRHILVIGATGGVGRHICREVIRLFSPRALLVGDYKATLSLRNLNQNFTYT